jgi:AraC-like DNA-binding protein
MPKTTTVDMINVHLTNVNRLTFNWLSSLYFFGVFKATDLEKALLTELCRHHAHRTGEHEVGCRCIDLLTVFWRQLFGCHQLSPELKPLLSLSPRLAEINRILGESLEDSEFCVRQWAEAASVSVAHLRNLVKHHYGVSPTALIQRQRLDRAAQMLRQHSDSVQEIAFDCGFSTVNYFHRVFRKHFGMTPGAWREADETCFQ